MKEKEGAREGANVLDTHIKAHPRKKGKKIAVACGFSVSSRTHSPFSNNESRASQIMCKLGDPADRLCG